MPKSREPTPLDECITPSYFKKMASNQRVLFFFRDILYYADIGFWLLIVEKQWISDNPDACDLKLRHARNLRENCSPSITAKYRLSVCNNLLERLEADKAEWLSQVVTENESLAIFQHDPEIKNQSKQ